MKHEKVVDLIANAPGKIRLTVAERFFPSSSDEEDCAMEPFSIPLQCRPRPLHSFGRTAPSVIPNTKSLDAGETLISSSSCGWQICVGYLGTIEMPTMIASSSKFQTVNSCIRRMRQEKRVPNIVLMTILPSYLSLKNAQNVVLANYAAQRITYVNSNDSKYLGLLTASSYANEVVCDASEDVQHQNNVECSNSCHVFAIDHKLIDHSEHEQKAENFQIECTRDQITGRCLEFPHTSEYVVDLLKSMYLSREDMSNAHMQAQASNLSLNINAGPRQHKIQRKTALEQEQRDANSPASSEVTNTSSNSDSGIGFHNDCIQGKIK